MPIHNHNKIINKVARKVLKVHGIEQKGQSRTWLDDQYWFTTIIEFQPFKDRQGTCLNVGVNFHWYEKEYFSFDIGNRESKFVDFANDEQFESEMNSLVELALKRTLELREKLSDSKTSEKTIINHEFASDSLWGNYHRAIISGLTDQPKKSEHYFSLILKNDFDELWVKELKNRISDLKTDLNNITEFQKSVTKIIDKTRKAKKLKETEIKNVWQQLA